MFPLVVLLSLRLTSKIRSHPLFSLISFVIVRMSSFLSFFFQNFLPFFLLCFALPSFGEVYTVSYVNLYTLGSWFSVNSLMYTCTDKRRRNKYCRFLIFVEFTRELSPDHTGVLLHATSKLFLISYRDARDSLTTGSTQRIKLPSSHLFSHIL